MPRYAPNKMSTDVKRRYFELIRTGVLGARAAQEVGVSLSCGSLWFIDAGSVSYVETPISGRYLSQDDRIEIADGLARGEQVKSIAARIGKSYQSVYREIARNRKPDGRYQPWCAHNQAHVRRRRPKPRRLAADNASPAAWSDTLTARLRGVGPALSCFHGWRFPRLVSTAYPATMGCLCAHSSMAGRGGAMVSGVGAQVAHQPGDVLRYEAADGAAGVDGVEYGAVRAEDEAGRLQVTGVVVEVRAGQGGNLLGVRAVADGECEVVLVDQRLGGWFIVDGERGDLDVECGEGVGGALERRELGGAVGAPGAPVDQYDAVVPGELVG